MARIIDPTEREMAVLDDLVPELARARVLDVGCGDGRATFRIAERAASVVGIDPDVGAIDRAKGSTPQSDSERVQFVAGDVSTLTMSEAQFDVAVFTRSL